MPQAVIAVAAWVGSSTAAVLGGGALATSLGAAAANMVVGLGFANGILAGVGAWGTALSLGSAAMSLTRKVPKPQSTGIQLDNKRDPNAPIPIVYGRTAVGGTLIYEATGDTKKTGDNIRLSRVMALSGGGPIEEIESFSAGGYQCTFNHDPTSGLAEVVSTDAPDPNSKLFKNNFRMAYRLGLVPETVDWATATGTAMRDVGANDKVSGVAVAIQHLDNLPENFPGGLPSDMRWVVKGIKCYDPRKDSTYPGGSGSHRLHQNDTYEWTENPYIIALDYIFGRFENGVKRYGMGASTTEVDIAAFVAGANICDDEDHNWKCGGELSSQDDHFQVVTTILQAGGGVPVNRGAQFSCVVRAPKTSVYTIGIDDVVGDAKIHATPSMRDRPNTVKPLWRNELENWELVGGETVSAPLYVEQDGGEEQPVEVSYPLVQQAAQAHQLATYDLMEAREFLQFTVTCRPRLLTVRVGDCVTVNLPEIASNNVKCLVISREFDPETFQVTLTLKSETDAKHAYALGQSQEAPVMQSLSGTYDGSNPVAPGEGEFADWFIVDNKIVSNGVTIPAIIVSGLCDDPNIAILKLEYKAFGDEDWTLAASAPVTTTRFEITNVKPLTLYEVSMTYVSVLNVPTIRILLGSITTADLRIPTVNVWDEVANAAISDLLEAIADDVAAVANAADLFDTIVEDVNLLGETQLESQLRDLEIREELESLTYLNGNTVANAITLVRNDLTETIDGQNAIVNTIAIIGAANANGTSFIVNTDLVMVSNTQSLGQKFEAIDVSFDVANALIIETAGAFADANAATANSIIELKAEIANNVAAIYEESNARATADGVTATKLSLLGAETANGTAWALDQTKVQVGGVPISSRLSSLQAAADGANASIINVQTAQAANNASFASQISSVSATAGSAQSSATTALNASTAQGARVTISTNVNGQVAGLQLINGGAAAGGSVFSVLADRFVIGSTAGGNLAYPFTVSGSTVFMDNVIARNIGANTITADKIVGGAVTTSSWSEQGYGATPYGGQVFSLGHSTTISYAPHQLVFNVGISNFSGMNGIIFSFYRNGTFIGQRAFITQGSYGYSFAGMIFDQPAAGYNSYTVSAQLSPGSQASPRLDWVNMMILELKK